VQFERRTEASVAVRFRCLLRPDPARAETGGTCIVLLIPPAAMIDFWFSLEPDAAGAKRFFQQALQSPCDPRPQVIVDGNPSYPKVIAKRKRERRLGRRCRCRTCPY
jgi:hypothetical protein